MDNSFLSLAFSFQSKHYFPKLNKGSSFFFSLPSVWLCESFVTQLDSFVISLYSILGTSQNVVNSLQQCTYCKITHHDRQFYKVLINAMSCVPPHFHIEHLHYLPNYLLLCSQPLFQAQPQAASIAFLFSRMSYKRNYTGYSPLCSASFTQHNNFWGSSI